MTASPDSLQQRYEAIERVYSERRWDEVASLSETLLLEVPDEPGDPLRQRLQLLLGHTYLYGYKDTATASGFYSRVQAATSETVLRDIADQGLQQCASQSAAQAAAEATSTAEPAAEPIAPSEEAPASPHAGQAFPFSAAPVANPSPQAAGNAAMPWMEQLGGVDPAAVLAVEVVEEPEQIDVAQADPARAEDLELTVTQAEISTQPEITATDSAQPAIKPRFSPEELAELSRGLLRVVIR